MPLDELQGEISDEPLHEDDLLRAEQAELQHVETICMVERCRHQLDLPVVVSEELTGRALALPGNRLTRAAEDDDLRCPGRSRGGDRLAGQGTRSGTGSDEYSEASSRELCRTGALVTPSQSPITTVGRQPPYPLRSHSGRSHRSGSTQAPAFHAPYMATTWATGIQRGDHRRTLAHPVCFEEPGDSIRCLVERTPTDVMLVPALFHENEGTVVWTFSRHLRETPAVGDGFQIAHRPMAPGLIGRVRWSTTGSRPAAR